MEHLETPCDCCRNRHRRHSIVYYLFLVLFLPCSGAFQPGSPPPFGIRYRLPHSAAAQPALAFPAISSLSVYAVNVDDPPPCAGRT